MNLKYLSFSFVLLLLISACKSSDLNKPFNSEQFNKTENLKYNIKDNQITFRLKNPLQCPVRIALTSNNTSLNSDFNLITLHQKSDTTFILKNANLRDSKIAFVWAFGDPKKEVKMEKLALPFSKNKKIRIIQSYKGSYSHNDDYSKYAIDFALGKNDTIKSADNGFVVGVIKDSKIGGKGEQYRNFANFITIYNPETGLFTQYVHMRYHSAMVKVGDVVKKGQPLGFVGITGNTDILHLHFNALIPNEGTIASIPIEFDHYKGIDFIKNQVIENN